jgi:hypothetical protein
VTLGYLLEWKGVRPAQFSRLVQAVEWQLAVLDGAVVYDPAADGILLAVRAYPSRGDFGYFYTRQLLPALGEIGLPKPVISSWALPALSPASLPDPLTVRFGPWLSLHPDRPGSPGRRN